MVTILSFLWFFILSIAEGLPQVGWMGKTFSSFATLVWILGLPFNQKESHLILLFIYNFGTKLTIGAIWLG